MSYRRKFRRQLQKAGRRPSKATVSSGPERIELQMSELEAILARVKSSLSPEEYDKLHGALETLLFLTQELEKNRVSVQRLKQLLFGASTEKTRKVLERALEQAGTAPQTEDEDSSPELTAPEKIKGHGRNGADHDALHVSRSGQSRDQRDQRDDDEHGWQDDSQQAGDASLFFVLKYGRSKDVQKLHRALFLTKLTPRVRCAGTLGVLFFHGRLAILRISLHHLQGEMPRATLGSPTYPSVSQKCHVVNLAMCV